MLIKSFEKKLKFIGLIAIISIVASIVISISSMFVAKQIINQENQNIYVLKDGIPIPMKRTSLNLNRNAEYKSHVNNFHYYFFNIPPDDAFIKKQMEKAMYLIDYTGMTEYKNLLEKGYYGKIVASSATLSISTDSIVLNGNDFTYYGKQRIDRKSLVLVRQIITKGSLKDIPRTDNNPHGVLIEEWETISNKDLSKKIKRDF